MYRSRVIRDVTQTPYIAEIPSKRAESINMNMVFKFSSLFNQTRFIDGFKEYIETETLKLNTRYNVKFDIYDDLALSYYKKIEKRIYGVEYKDKDSSIFYPVTITKEKLNEAFKKWEEK